MGIRKETFGRLSDGTEVFKYILENNNGIRLVVSDMGAVILELWVPDRNGKPDDVVLGFEKASAYEVNEPAFGAVIGRYANRISNAQFTLGGKVYQLDDNDASNCLHSGFDRYEHHIYEATCESGEGEEKISFSRVSPDMEQGFPGELHLTVTYTLNDENEVILSYHAVSDADTVINLTNHCYFNIGPAGHQTLDVRNQQMQVFADQYTPVNDILVPTGEIRSVEGTALDFREMHVIGERIGEATPDEKTVAGYDHNFILQGWNGEIQKAAIYQDQTSGRRMEVFTDCPGLQIYSAAPLLASGGKEGTDYGAFAGICFESQNYPNAVNMKDFPSPILRAGEEYERTAVFRFKTIESNK